MNIVVEYYDNEHRKALQANCSEYHKMNSYVTDGFTFEKEDLFSFCVFINQQLNSTDRKSYRDLQRLISTFYPSWEYYFEFLGNTIVSKYPQQATNKYYTQNIGEGVGLLIASKIYSLIEPDWEKIPETKYMKTLDYKFASTGNKFIEVEAKGSVVDQHVKTSSISSLKKSVEDKKAEQRNEQNNKNEMIGVISSLSSDPNLIAKAYLLDPPASEIPYEPLKYKLLARLYYYWRELRAISGAHFVEILINKIRTIQGLVEYRDIDNLPLLNRNGEPYSVPESLFESRSSSKDKDFFGEVFPLTKNRDKFYFYGYHQQVVEMLLKQDFDDICSFKCEPRRFDRVVINAKIPWNILKSIDFLEEESNDEKEEGRKLIEMEGDLYCLSSGKVIGFVQPHNLKEIRSKE